MLFYELPIEDQNYLIESFQKDGFKILERDDELVVEKNGDRIIFDSLSQGKFFVDFARFIFKKKILATNISGNFDVDSLSKFLKNEKKEKESVLDCLKRTAVKFNWSFVFLGKMKLIKDEDDASYLELKTDDGRVLTLVNFKRNPDKIYAVEESSFRVQKILKFDKRDYLRDNAPTAYYALQAVGCL